MGSASALTPAYLAELADAPHRGSLGTMFQLMVTLGILLAYVSNLGFLGHNLLGLQDWRWMLGSALIPAAALFFGSLVLPESPRYLVEMGKIDEAKEVLHDLRAKTNEDPDKELADIQSVANQPKGGLHELFTFARPAVLVAIGLMLLQQLVGINSVIYFLPQVFIKGFGFAEGDASGSQLVLVSLTSCARFWHTTLWINSTVVRSYSLVQSSWPLPLSSFQF